MVEEALRPLHHTLADRPERSGRAARGRLGLGLGHAALAGLALLFGWLAPERNAWAAAALLGALLLDALARAAAAHAARRGGIAARLRGLPSLVLGLGSGVGLAGAAAAAALALLAWPPAFPLLASALAGLVAIGACARLAFARIVLRIGRDPDLTRP
ncbi:hypothetical protein [Methylobacterium planeticum]|uniref:Transmembrane protein n=1 Tax=Methylobacterium planeticum TaxID=2615211 RepID=A0A6N6MM34_9HYPH|nr:hypothetical protein [Methylobacterium planeticum]KAB1071789.1 hypothetical protein F6X51_18445 [Methylobacterium planeticum]